MENMILQPIVVGGQTFKNRIMFPPLTTGYEKNGMISEQDMGFYTRLAKGGVGYIVLGDVAPINSFSPTPKLFDDSQIPAFKAAGRQRPRLRHQAGCPALPPGVRCGCHQQPVHAEEV